jgi:glycolate oxidase iron-sulfur subunit
MQTSIHPRFRNEPRITEAEAVLRSCVHCGFCNATCPTYLELGDERDGPRGRIYLIKQFLEDGNATSLSRRHLDRCLTCRSCETTCPSGVEYGRLLDFGRGLLERRVARGFRSSFMRGLLKAIVPYRGRFGLCLALARLLRPLMPATLAPKIPYRRRANPRPRVRHERRMLVLEGCVQAAATPNTNAATARVLDRLGISLVTARAAGCCGALSYHLGDHDDGLKFMRRNVDAWWPALEGGVEAIVMTASGCGALVKEYGALLCEDARYADKARRISDAAKDVSEILAAENLEPLKLRRAQPKIAVHCPCTLQHAQRLPDIVDAILSRLGFELAATKEPHLCCGSAGAYSVLERDLGTRLLGRKLAALSMDSPDAIVTANVGCQLHLASASSVPVRHWIELIDEAIAMDSRAPQ